MAAEDAEDAENAETTLDESYGVAEELEPIDADEETDAVAETEGLAYEVD